MKTLTAEELKQQERYKEIFNEIVIRLREEHNIKEEKSVASELGISPTLFTNLKKPVSQDDSRNLTEKHRRNLAVIAYKYLGDTSYFKKLDVKKPKLEISLEPEKSVIKRFSEWLNEQATKGDYKTLVKHVVRAELFFPDFVNWEKDQKGKFPNGNSNKKGDSKCKSKN